MLDHFVSESGLHISDVVLDDAGLISDHRLIKARLHINHTRRVADPHNFRVLNKINLKKFEESLKNSRIFTSPATTADEFADQIADVVAEELDKVAPLRTGNRRQPNPATKWLSPAAIEAKRSRRRYEKLWRSTGLETDRIKYRKVCRSANSIINESRRQYLAKRLHDCDSAKERWKVSKDLLHSAKYENTRTRVEDQQLCNTFSTFFNTKIEKLKLKILSRMNEWMNEWMNEFITCIPPVIPEGQAQGCNLRRSMVINPLGNDSPVRV